MSNTVYFFCLLIYACLISACGSKKEQQESEVTSEILKPNIIFILADDLGYGDLSCYGQTHFSTPNIDRLAAEGMRFMQYYAGSTVCAPSRSALLTGLHTGHTFIRGNKEVQPEGQYPIPDSAYTLPELLKEAGYVTGAFGKWGLGFPGSEGDPANQGFDQFFGYNCQRLAHNYYPWHLWDNQEKVMLEENEGTKKGAYAPDMIQAKTLKFIEENKDTSFFLYVPSVLPHAELAAPKEYISYFREKFEEGKPYIGVDDPDHENYKMGAYGSQPQPHATFAAMIKVLDDQVGQIVDKVKELGLEDNTIVIFTSDNGPHLEGGADPDFFNSNGPLKGYKRDLYEGGIRVPMIAYWPGKIEAGSESDHISAFWDVMPTLAELTDTEVTLDGISFLPTLTGNGEQTKHDYLYWEFHEQGGRQAVRKGNWKAVKLDVKENPDAPLELYDLSTDLQEENNVADEHPKMVEEIQGYMAEAHQKNPVFPLFPKERDTEKNLSLVD